LRAAVRSRGLGKKPIILIVVAIVLIAALVGVGIARAADSKRTLSADLPLGLYTSNSADRGNPVSLHRAKVRGQIYIAATAGSAEVRAVSFWMDKPTGQPLRVEQVFPYDFSGGAPDGSANALDTRTLADGEHVIFVEVTLKDESTLNAWATFTVANGGAAPTPTPTPSKSPTPKPTPTVSSTSQAPKPPSGGGKCPLPSFPTADCTGVPSGTKLATINGDYTVSKTGAVVEGKRITGDLRIEASGVKIKNSEIHGEVKNATTQSYEIANSTVGPPSGCNTAAAIGNSNYKATGVHIRNFSDGFRNEGNDILIQDSYVSLCSRTGDHSDGIQGYKGGSNVVIRHNTIDQRGANKDDVTAPIFFSDGSKGAVVEDNMFIGGGYTVRLYGSGYTFSGNVVVNKAWVFGPADNDCGGIRWSDNKLVEIDSNYRVTKVVSTLNCT
jgi:hypothetical protein